MSTRPPIAPRPVVPLPAYIRDLASGNPDPALLPDLDAALRESRFPPHLYGEQGALHELIECASPSFAAVGTRIDHVAVVSGGLDGLERIFDAHLRPGDRVLVEDPCYTGVLDLVRALGLIVQPVAIDASGMIPEGLAEALATNPAACVVTPRGQNPTGAALDSGRAADLRALLERHPDVLLVEDDHASWISGPAPATLVTAQRAWASVKSLNKSHGPDLRVAVLAGDATTVSRVQGRQVIGCGWVSHILQRLASKLLADHTVDQLLREATRTYERRRRGLIEALGTRGIAVEARSGFNVWIPVDEEEPITRGLLQLGWAVRGGEPYRIASAPAIRVTTATLEPSEAEALVADLMRLLRPEYRTHAP